jgi:hypothetical protein
MGVNGCMANAAANYNYTLTDAAHAYALNTTSTTMGQVWSDTMIGAIEAPILGGSTATNGFPLSGQAPSNTIDLTFATAPTVPFVGSTIFWNPSPGANVSVMNGVTIPDNIFVTSAVLLTGGSCPSGTCYRVGFSLPLTGTNPVPTTNPIQFYSYTGGFATPTSIQPYPLTQSCPTQNLNSSLPPATANSYAMWYYTGSVWADRQGDPYGAVIREYYENIDGAKQPGGVFPGGQSASPGCAGSFQTALNAGLPTEASWATQPQWRQWPIGAPQIDAAGKTTGCN